jgi:hypothetical protein
MRAAASAFRQSLSQLIIDGVIEFDKGASEVQTFDPKNLAPTRSDRGRILERHPARAHCVEFGKSTCAPTKGRSLNEFLT